jgi:two-component system sensor histidine kinase RpfC
MRRTFGLPPDLLGRADFQSAVVRLAIWAFGLVYIGLGAHTGYYAIDVSYFVALFAFFLVIAIALLISALRVPESTPRRYLGLLIDILATSLVIQLTQEAISPFYLFYIWVFISAGTRYGRSELIFATVVSVLAYNAVLMSLDHWSRHPFEAAFFMLLLVALPLYQYSLLRRVQQARAEAERANRAKSDFLAFMTHELRTPLTGVIGMTDLLETTELTDEQRDYVVAISRSAELLGSLIGNILDLSKIDARQLRLEETPFDLRATVKDVCGLMEPLALGKGLELILRVAPGLPARHIGDPLRVRQILLNLLGNAVKFTEQGEVELSVTPRPAEAALDRPHLLFEVRDTGIGIPADKLTTIFESFRQADESTTRRFGGSGLGTTIARDLAQLMGGAIGVDSVEGRGSRFWVRLPLAPAEAPPPSIDGRLSGLRALVFERNTTYRTLICDELAAVGVRCEEAEDITRLSRLITEPTDLLIVADAPQPVDMAAMLDLFRRTFERTLPCLCLTYAGRRTAQVDQFCAAHLDKPFIAEELITTLIDLTSRDATRDPPEHRTAAARPRPLAPARPDAAEIRILVAEDNEIAAKVIRTFLERLGFAVVLVDDGEEALRTAREGRFDIAFIDLRMPKLDGIAFTRAYRAEERAGHLPIIALTANAAEDTKTACLAAGMDDFLSKPVKADSLRDVVARFVPAIPT